MYSVPLSAWIRTFLPMECPLCGEASFDGTPGMFCKNCLSQLEFVEPPLCPGCGAHLDGILDCCPDCLNEPPRKWKQAFAVFSMTGLARRVIHSYKYRMHPELARALGRLAADKLSGELRAKAPLLVPTPLHYLRYLWRGYNQAELVCEGISAVTGLRTVRALRRIKWTRQQAGLKRTERIKNIHAAFSIRDSTIVRGRAILLVDDVMTTGATLDAETRILLEAGAAEVYVLVIARRQRN